MFQLYSRQQGLGGLQFLAPIQLLASGCCLLLCWHFRSPLNRDCGPWHVIQKERTRGGHARAGSIHGARLVDRSRDRDRERARVAEFLALAEFLGPLCGLSLGWHIPSPFSQNPERLAAKPPPAALNQCLGLRVGQVEVRVDRKRLGGLKLLALPEFLALLRSSLLSWHFSLLIVD